MKLSSALAFGFVALLLTSSTAFAQDETRQPAPDFELDSLDGDAVSLSDFAGDVVVVNFWATWCQPCLQEMPFFSQFQDTYGDDGLTILAITTDGPETLAEVRTTVRRGRWSMTVLLDQEGDVASILNPRGTNPYTLFIDRNGNIAQTHEGYAAGDEVEYEEIIQALLAE